MVTIEIAIIGLGLMGGSLAKALKYRYDTRITAVDHCKETLRLALMDGSISNGYLNIEDVYWGNFDLIFFGTPVEQTIQRLKVLEGKIKDSCIITDLGSTKEEIMKAVKGFNFDFIGGHPMVGSEKIGYEHSKGHLYENAYYVLTPNLDTPRDKLEVLIEIIGSIGAIPIVIPPNKHDLVTAVISHVPHVVASAIVHLVTSFENGDDLLYRLAAGGFKDITRIASSNPTLWKQISLSNRDKINKVLKELIIALSEFANQLEIKNDEYILQFFQKGKNIRDRFSETTITDIPRHYALTLDIEDKPGMIAKVSNILFEANINIKNIGIIHNREFDHGVLKIVVENQGDLNKAQKILADRKFSIINI